jgi:hypothetical protein
MAKTETKTKLLRDPRPRAERRAAKGGKRQKSGGKIKGIVAVKRKGNVIR